ncbi:MAG: hypothetical protein DSO07_07225 [Thermoproteota archaeon]|uniref:Uncharacterized protein n=1 Tax=Candidatus Methanodesulfokora washburnensis TaxID=2478471 RepID=A0A429GCU2_9CREN|nr:hypothetical protein [Candidatus Methanodesulfokores washburnensis]RSN71635.1 hypothetical protein D6D85_15615 [Candidatus Methanodesulfokores washburnensis]TDA40919.1 MAG: hypothetical protein DSO07_07225 [Candidatus Korarchaeota archaeon]
MGFRHKRVGKRAQAVAEILRRNGRMDELSLMRALMREALNEEKVLPSIYSIRDAIRVAEKQGLIRRIDNDRTYYEAI